MTAAAPFDLQTTPLHPGLTLLEAGAGSGKTYTIEGTFLRLLLEVGLEVPQILVVTFTEAATAELRDRIRTRLRDALLQLRQNSTPTDPALLASQHLPRKDRMQRLMLALESFDEAQIFTIHGFCQRILKEHAFETGSTFDAEIQTDDSLIKRQLERDFCRRVLADLPMARMLLEKGKHMGDLLGVLKARGAHRHVALEPAPTATLPQLEATLWDCLTRIKDLWLREQQGIIDIITNKVLVNKGLWEPALEYARLLDFACSRDDRASDAVDAIYNLTRTNVEKEADKRSLKKDPGAVQHVFFDLCQEFYELAGELRISALHAFVAFADAELEAIKRRDNILTFDDLLSRVARCLEGDMGDQLCKSLNERYKAALVDEFQDTDGLQWSIFSRLFGGEAGAYFYIIGDPKQAIYRFRGADIHSYLGAAKTAQRCLTLLKNWRSDAELIDGFNAVFQKPKAFIEEEIIYSVAQHCGKPQSEPFIPLGSLCKLPLRFILKDEPIPRENKPEVEEWALNAATADIQSLLLSRSRLGEREVAPRDVAVLVRTSRQALKVQERLIATGIPAVLETDASVFDSDEATVLEQVLAAGLSPANGPLVRAALASPLFGLSANELDALERQDADWDQWLDLFAQWHELWETHGFMFSFRALSQQKDIQARILALPKGERRMTNLLHLCEILHQAEGRQKLSPTGLLAWLRDRIHDKSARSDEEHQLRTESEGNAVKVLTMHKSKGLQFPFVFCPFMGEPGLPREDSFSIVNVNGQPTLYLKPYKELDEDARERAAKEELASEIRLFYVALTRARHRCHVYVGITKTNSREVACGAIPLCSILGATGWEQLKEALLELAKECPHGISVEPREQTGPPATVPLEARERAELSARALTRHVPQTGMLSSFSSLRGGRVEAPDREEIVATTPQIEAAESPATGPHAFPRGPVAGNFFHAVLEYVELPGLENLEEQVDAQLKRHALSSEWRETALQMCRNALDAPLIENECRLSGMDGRSILRELEFYIPVKRLDVSALAEAFESQPPPYNNYARQVRNMRAPEVEGYLKGFIDMVFRHEGRYYILDWKSNHLGNGPRAYDEAGLEKAILNEAYFLQYCLYSVALNRYLASRIPDYDYETHFGGVRYVFLRGLEPENPGHGIHVAAPPQSLVLALDAALVNRAMEEAI